MPKPAGVQKQTMIANTLTQMTEEPIKRDVLRDLKLTNEECLVGGMMAESSLGYTDHEMVE